jgi:(p)ppGpp synthase/HD superfamily hydrolase
MTTETHNTFFARIEPWMAPSDLMRVRIAYQLAKSAHRYQTRSEVDESGNPIRYFDHPRAVAIILLDELCVQNADLIIAALLHDTLEDTRVSPEMIEHLFGANVVRDTKLVSKLPKEGFYDRLIKFGTFGALLVKGADRLHNLRTLHQATMAFKKKQYDETVGHRHLFLELAQIKASTGSETMQSKYLADLISVELRGLARELEE